MKANELMVGDWVCYSKANNYYTRINEIRHTEVPLNDQWYIEGMRSDNDKISPNAVEYFAVETLSPIPLTAEILEKNGFDISDKEVMQYHFEEDGEKYHFSLRQMYDKDGKPHGYSFYAFNVLTLLDYVHELQHALRLCGIKKEIEL